MSKRIHNILSHYLRQEKGHSACSLKMQFPFLIFMFLCFRPVIFAQSNVEETIKASLDKYNTAGIKEKIYVHTNKDYYLTGEILWFKLYYTDAVSNRPINLSKVAYVELLDKENQPVLQAKAGLNEGKGTGSVLLPEDIVSGNYKMRAYTQWMKNSEADYFFEKMITIVNLNKFSVTAADTISDNTDVQFFPEGGNLVSGIRSKVAFKATDPFGKGVNFTGYLLENADTILKFQPSRAGMGYFLFTPQQGRNYSAVIARPGNKTTRKELPPVQPTGTSMLLSESDDGVITITASTNDAGQPTFYLLAHTRSSVKITKAEPVQNGKAVFSFDKKVLGDGVSHLTLFDSKKVPVCERLYFKRPENQLALGINTDKQSYAKRKEVSIDFSSAQLQTNDTASLSMTVFRLDSLQQFDQGNILYYLYLSSDLKGVVENPGAYFNAGKEAALAADNLMLTQGWRRFKWSDVLTNKQPAYEFAPEIKGHIITGKVTNGLTGQSRDGVSTYIGAPSGITQFGAAVSDRNGNLKFEMRNFFGGSFIVAQQNSLTSDSVYRFRANSPFSTTYTQSRLPRFVKPVGYPNTLLQQSMSVQVQNIYTSEQMNRFSYPYFTDTAAFFMKPDFHYELDKYTRFTSMEEVLREYVILVNVRRRNGRVELPIINPAIQQYLPGQPLNLLDGVPVFDFTQFFEFDPLKIKSLDVIVQKYIYGQMAFDGILNWKTYTPSTANYNLPSNAVVIPYEGMLAEREFYTPVYDTPESLASRIPDYRTALYWNPYVTLAGQNEATVRFYTSDLAGKYGVVIEGLSGNGMAGSAATTFEVK